MKLCLGLSGVLKKKSDFTGVKDSLSGYKGSGLGLGGHYEKNGIVFVITVTQKEELL